MLQGNLTSFAPDRFGTPNSALNLNGGFTQVPSGFFFDSPQFSVSTWIYPSTVGSWARVFDFGNGQGLLPYEFVQLSISASNTYQPSLVLHGTNQNTKIQSPVPLEDNQWYFLAGTFNGSHVCLYINATLMSISLVSDQIAKVERKSNFFGKSNFITDEVSFSYLDEIRFYNTSLSPTQITQLMNDDSKNSFLACSVMTTSSTDAISTNSISLTQSISTSTDAITNSNSVTYSTPRIFRISKRYY